MSGFAGFSRSRNRKPEGSTSSGYARNSRKECAGLVAGQAVLTAEAKDGGIRKLPFRPRPIVRFRDLLEPVGEGKVGGRKFHKLLASAMGWLVLGQTHHGGNPHRETDPCTRDDVADAAFWNEKRAAHANNYGCSHNVITRCSEYPG